MRSIHSFSIGTGKANAVTCRDRLSSWPRMAQRISCGQPAAPQAVLSPMAQRMSTLRLSVMPQLRRTGSSFRRGVRPAGKSLPLIALGRYGNRSPAMGKRRSDWSVYARR